MHRYQLLVATAEQEKVGPPATRLRIPVFADPDEPVVHGDRSIARSVRDYQTGYQRSGLTPTWLGLSHEGLRRRLRRSLAPRSGGANPAG